MQTRCRACDSPQLETLLDCGAQPADHLFPTTKEEIVTRHPLKLGICGACELVQWVECRPRAFFAEDQFAYREPEFHLDAMAKHLETLPLPHDFRIGLISEKDRSLAARLTAGKIVEAPPFDLLISRHAAEHADSLSNWLSSWRAQLSPTGYLYIEVPDAAEALEKGDATVLWEQHQIYFSEVTLQRSLAIAGFRAEPLPIPESSSRSEGLLAMLADPRVAPAWPQSRGETERARAFPLRLARQRRHWESILSGKKVAALGAGHDLVTFLSAHRLTKRLDFVADDHPRKLGHFLPGSELPIYPVTAIRRSRTDVCLLGVMAESEPKVLARLEEFCQDGGEVFSIYPSSRLAPRSICQSDLSPLS